MDILPPPKSIEDVDIALVSLDAVLARNGVPVFLRQFYASIRYGCLDFSKLSSEACTELERKYEPKTWAGPLVFTKISNWYRDYYPQQYFDYPMRQILIVDPSTDNVIPVSIGYYGEPIVPRKLLKMPHLKLLFQDGGLSGHHLSVAGILRMRWFPLGDELISRAVGNYQQAFSAFSLPYPDYNDVRWQLQQATEKIFKAVLTKLKVEKIKERAGHNILTNFDKKPKANAATLVELLQATPASLCPTSLALCELIECSTFVRYGKHSPVHPNKDICDRMTAYTAYQAFLHLMAINASSFLKVLAVPVSASASVLRQTEASCIWRLVTEHHQELLRTGYYCQGQPLSSWGLPPSHRTMTTGTWT